MAHIRSTVYGAGLRPRRIPRMMLEVAPLRGLHSGKPYYALQPGYTPDSRNFVVAAGAITPRSGMSLWASGLPDLSASSTFGPVLGGAELFDREGNLVVTALGSNGVAVLDGQSPSWRTLSGPALSGTTVWYWDMSYMYSSGLNQNQAYFTNGKDIPHRFTVQPNVTAYSAFTTGEDLVKTAASVIVSDERLVWGNVETDGDGPRPKRVVWSVRGNSDDYTLALGAGFRDLEEMRGQVTRLVEDREGFIILTDHETWRARPRRDSFAFDFFAISQEISCPFPQTAVKTPIGVVFLGQDLEVYLVTGAEIRLLGQDPEDPQGNSRVRTFMQTNFASGSRPFGVWNRELQRYELYFSATGADYPNRALYYDAQTNSFWEQRMPFEVSYGFDVMDPGVLAGTSPSWDAETATWNAREGTWNIAVERPQVENRDVAIFRSTGSAYRFRTGQTDDDGTAIDCRWRSHGLQGFQDRHRYEQLEGVWVEYTSAATSVVSVFVGNEGSLGDITQLSLRSSQLSYEFVGARATGRSPQFEIRLNDGGTPSFSVFECELARRNRYGGGR